MSSEIAIKVENLSKCFQIYDKPRDRLLQGIMPRLQRLLGTHPKQYCREFWALRDVSFEVNKGETIGIIGRNGSGKSTLLQMICGTLTPTSGTISTKGRVAALLELGAGFNPDFTGRENVYMNASILGLTKEEIDARLDDIASFADIGEFMEQPVKTYSSGMYVRLAFAIVSKVEPDILIIDEALAVGDAKFQLKCFRRLESIRESGTTILFVTHDASTVKSFCTRAALLDSGKLLGDGKPNEIVMQYFNLLFPKDSRANDTKNDIAVENNISEFEDEITIYPNQSEQKFGLGGAIVEYVTIKGCSRSLTLTGGDHLVVTVKYSWDSDNVIRLARENDVLDNLIMGVSISDNKGTYLFGCTTYDKSILVDINGVLNKVTFSFKTPKLRDGKYFINCALALGTQEAHTQLCWYDGLIEMNILSPTKYVYGLFYNDYDAQMRG